MTNQDRFANLNLAEIETSPDEFAYENLKYVEIQAADYIEVDMFDEDLDDGVSLEE